MEWRTVNVEALLLSVDHVVNTALILGQYRLRLGWIEPVRGEDHIYAAAAAVTIGFQQRRRQRSYQTTACKVARAI